MRIFAALLLLMPLFQGAKIAALALVLQQGGHAAWLAPASAAEILLRAALACASLYAGWRWLRGAAGAARTMERFLAAYLVYLLAMPPLLYVLVPLGLRDMALRDCALRLILGLAFYRFGLRCRRSAALSGSPDAIRTPN